MTTLAIGRRRRGKTTLIYQRARRRAQRVMLDPRRQFATGAPIVETPDDTESAMREMFADASRDELIVAPSVDVSACFDAACGVAQMWVQTDPSRPLAIVIDEARFYSLATLPRTHAFHWLLRCAPHETMDVYLSAHRPTDDEIPISVQSIADVWLLFQTTQPHDLRSIRERAGDEVAARVSSLDQYAWVEWDDGMGEARYHRPLASFVAIAGPSADVSMPETTHDSTIIRVPQTRLFG